MIQLSWQERVRKVQEIHKELCRKDKNHTIRDTAKILNRSYGSVNEDLMLSSWLDTHPRLHSIRRITDAIIYVRGKKQEMRVRAS